MGDGLIHFSLLIGIIEFMAQNGGNIDLVDDINYTLFARDFRMPADDYAIYQFIAHFAGKLGRFEIFLDIPYEGIGALNRVFRILHFRFEFFYLRYKSFLFVGIFLNQSETDIFGHIAFYPVFVGDLYQAG